MCTVDRSLSLGWNSCRLNRTTSTGLDGGSSSLKTVRLRAVHHLTTAPLRRRRCACFAQWTKGPHQSYTEAGWIPQKLHAWFGTRKLCLVQASLLSTTASVDKS